MLINQSDKAREQALPGFPMDLYDELLYAELVPLIDAHEIYSSLYAGPTPDNVILMNEIASFFFGNIQRTLVSSMVMGIGRLMDKPSHKSLEYLKNTIQTDLRTRDDQENFNHTKKIFDELQKTAEPIIAYRHTHLGHRGRDQAAPPLIKKVLDDSIEGITDFIKHLGWYYGSIEVNLTEISMDRKFLGTDALLDCLRHCKEKKKEVDMSEEKKIPAGIDLGYDVALKVMEYSIKRFDVQDDNINKALAWGTTISTGFFALIVNKFVNIQSSSVTNLLDFHSIWFTIAIVSFIAAFFFGLSGKIGHKWWRRKKANEKPGEYKNRGNIAIISPAILFSKWRAKDEVTFKSDCIHMISEHYEHNSKLVQRKWQAVLLTSICFFIEIIALMLWVKNLPIS